MRHSIFATLLVLPLAALADSPDCDGPNNWAPSMAHATLKNAGIIDNSKVDFERTKVVRLASEKIGGDLYRQVHLVTFVLKDGSEIEAVTVNDASNDECSMSGVEVMLVREHFSP